MEPWVDFFLDFGKPLHDLPALWEVADDSNGFAGRFDLRVVTSVISDAGGPDTSVARLLPNDRCGSLWSSVDVWVTARLDSAWLGSVGEAARLVLLMVVFFSSTLGIGVRSYIDSMCEVD